MRIPRFQFSLASLLIFITLAAVALGVLARLVVSPQLKEQAAIKALGGTQMTMEGDGFFSHAVEAYPLGRPAKDLLHLQDLPHLQKLGVGDFREKGQSGDTAKVDFTPLSEPIPRLDKLSELRLYKVDDCEPVFAFLGKSQPERLFIYDSHLTKAAIEQINTQRLKSLWIESSVLDHLVDLPLPQLANIENLYLHQTGMDDSQLTLLKNFPKLKLLVLRYLETSPDSLKLLPLDNLEVLILRNLQITDESLSALYQAKNIQEIQLLYTQVTPAGADALEAALPNCNIRLYPAQGRINAVSSAARANRQFGRTIGGSDYRCYVRDQLGHWRRPPTSSMNIRTRDIRKWNIRARNKK